MKKIKVWLIRRLKERTTWVGIVALLGIFGVGSFDMQTVDQIANAFALIFSAVLIGMDEKEQL